ncbi:transporter [Rubrivirga sp. IMCC43871]|uniref:transporter n=1 Tax=Rubrivirga sp. IMCC43871 TaxID=3391575 RepID=UPI00398FAA99
MTPLSRFAAVAAFLLVVPDLAAQPWTSGRPDGHAPIGVMGDHTHGGQEAMVSLRTMWMPMEGSRIGTTSIADELVVASTMVDGDTFPGQGFTVTPSKMPMRMDMLGVMVAPTRRITIMAMVPYVTYSMDHKTRASVAADPDAVAFSTESSGLGDVSLTALVLLAEPERQRIHAGLGVSLPTGSIDATDDTPMGADQQLPYPMQQGTGSVGLRPSLTYLGQSDRLGWGAQARLAVQVGENDRSYTVGPKGGLTAWGSAVLNEILSASVRVDGQAWSDIDGADPAYAMAVATRFVPTVFPDLRAGERVDVSVGLNGSLGDGPLAGLRAAVEVGVPVYQRLDGPQLETDLVVTIGAQYAFDL